MKRRKKAYNSYYNRVIKRLIDVLISGTAVIILSPVYLIIAVMIALEDGFPVLYRADRGGYMGKPFRIAKFRSMVKNADKIGGGTTALHDSRITKTGEFLRKTKLDELPQLFNIFRGDMSVVGPRPERPEIAAQYYESIPDFRLRLQVKAGLTGYAQVYGKYNTDPYEKLEFDLLYINNMSVLTDLRLIFATISILFASESTEGIEAGQTNAISSVEEDP